MPTVPPPSGVGNFSSRIVSFTVTGTVDSVVFLMTLTSSFNVPRKSLKPPPFRRSTSPLKVHVTVVRSKVQSATLTLPSGAVTSIEITFCGPYSRFSKYCPRFRTNLSPLPKVATFSGATFHLKFRTAFPYRVSSLLTESVIPSDAITGSVSAGARVMSESAAYADGTLATKEAATKATAQSADTMRDPCFMAIERIYSSFLS